MEETMENKTESKKNKFNKRSAIRLAIIICVALFFAVDLVLLGVYLSKKNRSALLLNISAAGTDLQAENLIALDSFSRKSFIKKNGQAVYLFHENQKQAFAKLYTDSDNVALTVRLKISPDEEEKDLITEDNIFAFGFITKEDLNKDGKKLVKDFSTANKVVVKGSVNQLLVYTDNKGCIDISFALPRQDGYTTDSYLDNYVPEGFFVLSDTSCEIQEACITPALLGFDRSAEIPFYGYTTNGGIIDFAETSFDFKNAGSAYYIQTEKDHTLPVYEIKLSSIPEYKSTADEVKNIELYAGGEKFYINNVAAADYVILPGEMLKNPFVKIDFTQNRAGVSGVLLRTGRCAAENYVSKSELPDSFVTTPIRIDPGLILDYPVNYWRTEDYEIFEWDRFPGILFFDTKNYAIQDLFFRRMAYFVEKAGYKGTLVSNEVLEGKHGYNAHDYSAASMAEFFNKATDEEFVLYPEEMLLKEILIQNGLLEVDGKYVKANEGGLVSISRETPDWSRKNLLAHEGWHTLFFRDEDFRNYVSAVFYTMDSMSKDFIIDYFKSQPSLGYDVTDEYLVHNEFMAYIMQSPLSGVAEYFVNHANWGSVMRYTPELAAYVRKTKGAAFEDAAVALNDYVYDRFGVICGNIGIIHR